MCGTETKTFEITVIILRYIRNVNFLIKKDFKIAELTKTSFFFFTLETVLKMAKEKNKGNFESICTKVTKPMKKGGES